MAQSYIRVSERHGVFTLTIHEAVAKGTRVLRAVELGDDWKSELREAVVTNVAEVRELQGRQGRLTDG